jgi:AbrB family looped-hinge helix DNA binding protein
MNRATLSSKNQIVIPREAREALGVKAGDQLLVVGAGVYPGGHIAKERKSWA